MKNTPKIPTPEEMAKIQKKRVLSDVELLKNGAEYKFSPDGDSILVLKKNQVDEIKNDFAVEKRLLAEAPECYSEDLNKIIEKYGGLDKLINKIKTDFDFAREFWINELPLITKTKNTDAVINSFKKAIAEGMLIFVRKERDAALFNKNGYHLGAQDAYSFHQSQAMFWAGYAKKLLTEIGEEQIGEKLFEETNTY